MHLLVGVRVAEEEPVALAVGEEILAGYRVKDSVGGRLVGVVDVGLGDGGATAAKAETLFEGALFGGRRGITTNTVGMPPGELVWDALSAAAHAEVALLRGLFVVVVSEDKPVGVAG